MTAKPKSMITGTIIKIPNQEISFFIEIKRKAKIIAVAEATANSYMFPIGARCAAMALKINATARNVPISQVRAMAIFETLDCFFD